MSNFRNEHGAGDFYDTKAWKDLKKAVKEHCGDINRVDITVKEEGYQVILMIDYKFK